MIYKTCCFTGHRYFSRNQISIINNELIAKIEELIKQNVLYFVTGGALGFDTLVAEVILDLKKENEQIKLILAVPCKDQAARWKYEDRMIYENIKGKADKVIYLSKEYKEGCMLERNRYMVDHSKFVIVAWDGRKSVGTFYTLNYAKKQRRNIILINFGGNYGST